MSKSSGRSSRSRRAAFGVALSASLVVALAGCSTPSNTPEAYDDTVKTNFMNGCTATAPPAKTGETGESLGDGASDQYCECAYNWFVNNVPYSDSTASEGQAPANPAFAAFDFKTINADLADDPEAMPEEIKTALAEACGTSEDPGTPGSTTPAASGAEADPDDATTSSVPG